MELSQLNKLHLEDIQNPVHPSVFFENDDYNILIYRLFNKDTESLNIQSHSFVIDANDEIFRYDKESEKLSKINGYGSLYKILDALVDESMVKVEDHIFKIEDLEEMIYNQTESIKIWFSLKKDLVRMERVLLQAVRAHKELMKNSKTINEDSSLYTNFEDIDEHLNRIYRSCSNNIAKLDNIYNLYTTLSNEKMNSTIYILTVISAIFLPVNLVVGFFGMNTENLFFTGNPNGTMIVSGIIVALLFSLGLLFLIRNKRS